jgi:HSP20 family protein
MNIRAIVPFNRENGIFSRTPLALFGALQREVDRLVDDFSRGGAVAPSNLMPSMDVVETDKEIELTVELPGLEQKDVDISVTGDILTIRGEKKAEAEHRDKNSRVVERAYGTFYRAFQIPPGTDPSSVNATMSKGILKITIPKPAHAESKKIEVKDSA